MILVGLTSLFYYTLLNKPKYINEQNVFREQVLVDLDVSVKILEDFTSDRYFVSSPLGVASWMHLIPVLAC